MTYKEDVLELLHVVNTLGEELSLHLVDDLIHTVSPVGHSVLFLLIIAVNEVSLSKTG